MKILELFAGTKSVSSVFEKNGHDTYTIDWDKQHENIDWYTDIGSINANDILQRFGKPSVIWVSPDCTTYSIAAISHHRTKEANGNLSPKSDYAKFCDQVNAHVLQLIKDLDPLYFFIENPRGGFRKMNFIQNIPRYTVTYCQYELDKPLHERRMKPTDIFTNHPNPQFKPICKNNAPCHVPAKRGSSTGTQGIKNKIDRSRIPTELCKHILKICTNQDN